MISAVYYFITILISLPVSISAEPGSVRTTLMLTGQDCSNSRPTIVKALEQSEGIRQVYPNLMPDHLLVDHNSQELTEDQILAIVSTAFGEGRTCRAELMKSCISANPIPHRITASP